MHLNSVLTGLVLSPWLALLCMCKDEPPRTPLRIHNAEYERYCGPQSGKHPCFTFWSGDMSNVAMTVLSGPKVADVKDAALIKDGDMRDFTVRPSDDFFEVRFLGTDGCRLRYSRRHSAPGCYEITLYTDDDTDWRIWASDESGNDRDIDTLHYATTSKTFCDNKWIHVHVKQDSH